MGHVPGAIEAACEYLEEQNAMPHLVAETRKMYERPDDMFREVWHGSGKQLIPSFSEEARVEYIQLIEVLIEKYDYMGDLDLYYTLTLLGSVGMLGAKHLGEICGVPRKNIDRALYRPKTAWVPRLGGDFNRAGLAPVKASLRLILEGRDPDFTKLYEAKEAGISMVLLSRLCGIPAQTLTKRFRTIAKRLKEAPVDHSGDGIKADTHLEGHSISSSEGIPVTEDGSEAKDESLSWPQYLADDDIAAELAKRNRPTTDEMREERSALMREYAGRRRKAVGNGMASGEAGPS